MNKTSNINLIFVLLASWIVIALLLIHDYRIVPQTDNNASSQEIQTTSTTSIFNESSTSTVTDGITRLVGNPGFSFNITFPTFTEEETPAFANINDTIKASAKNMLIAYTEEASARLLEFAQRKPFFGGLPASGNYLQISNDTFPNDQLPNILAVNLQSMWYIFMGSMHPIYTIQTLNFDKQTGEVITLSDVFLKKKDYMSTLYEQTEIQIDAWNQTSPRYPMTIPKDFGERYFTHILFLKKGIRVQFEFYQLGGRPTGQPTILIPYENLTDIIDPDGPLGSFVRK